MSYNLLFIFGIFNCFLNGLGKNWVYVACCLSQTALIPVQTSSATDNRHFWKAYCSNTYNVCCGNKRKGLSTKSYDWLRHFILLCWLQGWWNKTGRGVHAPKILADLLTLLNQGGADFTHHIITGPPDFQSFLRPWDVSNRKLIVCANTVRFFIWTFTVVGHQRFSSINCEVVFFSNLFLNLERPPLTSNKS